MKVPIPTLICQTSLYVTADVKIMTLVDLMQVHPVSLGIFNFVNAWSMMFWPVMLADRKGQAVKQRFPLWFGTQARLSLAMQLSTSQCIPTDAQPICHKKGIGFLASKPHALD